MVVFGVRPFGIQECHEVQVQHRKEGSRHALPCVLHRAPGRAEDGEHRCLHHGRPHAKVGAGEEAAPRVRLVALIDERAVDVDEHDVAVVFADVHLHAHHVGPAHWHQLVVHHRVLLAEQSDGAIFGKHREPEQRHVARDDKRHRSVRLEALVLVRELRDRRGRGRLAQQAFPCRCIGFAGADLQVELPGAGFFGHSPAQPSNVPLWRQSALSVRKCTS
mmetsp:Transcript_73661/g.213382  ORF Transcript_73661/g.213382 Transcript_73661/m.213382 type:complete len:219 (-) Transcript_73661:7-663(-)